jgi:uncharacterized membrane protein
MPLAAALLLLLLSVAVEILKQAGVEPTKLAGQIAIEPALASRVDKTRTAATGQIRGRVFDEYGASIPDASVSFQPVDPRSGLTSFEAIADSRGRFDFADVRPGTYRVTGKALGFETTVITQEVAAGVETEVTVVVRRREPRPAGITRPASASEARRPGTRRARNRNATQ